jgi:hypothetical protein
VARARVKEPDQAVKGPALVEEAKKSIMGTLLTHNPLKDQGLEDQSGVPLRDANPSIKDLESHEIQAKASDFDEFSSKSAIILDLQQFAAVLGGYRLMLRST